MRWWRHGGWLASLGAALLSSGCALQQPPGAPAGGAPAPTATDADSSAPGPRTVSGSSAGSAPSEAEAPASVQGEGAIAGWSSGPQGADDLPATQSGAPRHAAAGTTRERAFAGAPDDGFGRQRLDQAPDPRTQAPVLDLDEFGSDDDRGLNQRIRQALAERPTLHAAAPDIAITTINGVVTLRGAVADEREKADLVEAVRGVEGIKRLDDQLDVAGR